MSSGSFHSLIECELDQPVSVARITDQDPEFLQYIAGAGLNLGVSLRVVERSRNAESVRLELGPAKRVSRSVLARPRGAGAREVAVHFYLIRKMK